jgi:WD40 repeat protein
MSGFITKKGGGRPLVINGQKAVSGIYQEAIFQFDTVYSTRGNLLELNKLSDPNIMPGFDNTFSTGVAFSPDDNYLAFSYTSAPYTIIYKKNRDTFTKIGQPDIAPTGSAEGISFSFGGTYLAVAHQTLPFITIYKRDGDTFTKLTNPATLPTGQGRDTAFTTDGTYLAVAHSTSPYITIYKRNGDTFTKLNNPASLPETNQEALSVSFSPDGIYLAVALRANGGNFAPYLNIYKRDGDTFTKLANPNILPDNTARDVKFSPDGSFLAVAYDTSILLYSRSGDTFSALDPIETTFGAYFSVAFSKEGRYLVAGEHNLKKTFFYELTNNTFVKREDLTIDALNSEGNHSYAIDFSFDSRYVAFANMPSRSFGENIPPVSIYKIEYLQLLNKANNEIRDTDY